MNLFRFKAHPPLYEGFKLIVIEKKEDKKKKLFFYL